MEMQFSYMTWGGEVNSWINCCIFLKKKNDIYSKREPYILSSLY